MHAYTRCSWRNGTHGRDAVSIASAQASIFTFQYTEWLAPDWKYRLLVCIGRDGILGWTYGLVHNMEGLC